VLPTYTLEDNAPDPPARVLLPPPRPILVREVRIEGCHTSRWLSLIHQDLTDLHISTSQLNNPPPWYAIPERLQSLTINLTGVLPPRLFLFISSLPALQTLVIQRKNPMSIDFTKELRVVDPAIVPMPPLTVYRGPDELAPLPARAGHLRRAFLWGIESSGRRRALDAILDDLAHVAPGLTHLRILHPYLSRGSILSLNAFSMLETLFISIPFPLSGQMSSSLDVSVFKMDPTSIPHPHRQERFLLTTFLTRCVSSLLIHLWPTTATLSERRRGRNLLLPSKKRIPLCCLFTFLLLRSTFHLIH
jgi:hypothetical protein